jgi:hypothetical protein
MKTWLAGLVVVGGLGYALKGGCLNSTSAPDEKIAERMGDICTIARDGGNDPVKGVKKLGKYFDAHTGDLLGEWGETLATIERIPDDRKHDDRARLARDRIQAPLIRCNRELQRFGNAIEASPEASAMMQRFSVRFNRTIEIIFGGKDFGLLKLELYRALPSTSR